MLNAGKVRDEIPLCIAFELSNRCNYSHIHPECPTDAKADPVFLDTDIIKDTIRFLGRSGYAGKGTIYFNVFNEPLIDPRLFMLLEYNKEHCGAGVCLYTNGWGLNQYMADELAKLNVGITVSRYTDKEDERLLKVVGPIGARITLDPRFKTIYGSPPTRTGPCYFPSIYSIINHKGEHALCCREYEWRHPLGDLKINTFEEVLKSEYRNEVCDRLEAGDRFLDACSRCPFPGWGVINDPFVG